MQTLSVHSWNCGPVRWGVVCRAREQARKSRKESSSKKVTLGPMSRTSVQNKYTKLCFFSVVQKEISMKLSLFLLISSIVWGRIYNFLRN